MEGDWVRVRCGVYAWLYSQKRESNEFRYGAMPCRYAALICRRLQRETSTQTTTKSSVLMYDYIYYAVMMDGTNDDPFCPHSPATQ